MRDGEEASVRVYGAKMVNAFTIIAPSTVPYSFQASTVSDAITSLGRDPAAMLDLSRA
jgi:hypothetical protein